MYLNPLRQCNESSIYHVATTKAKNLKNVDALKEDKIEFETKWQQKLAANKKEEVASKKDVMKRISSSLRQPWPPYHLPGLKHSQKRR